MTSTPGSENRARSEPPHGILDEIAQGFKNHTTPFKLIVDRREAIEAALRAAAPGDLVVIAGKGHEGIQVIRDKKLPFDDRQTVREILKDLLGERGGENARP